MKINRNRQGRKLSTISDDRALATPLNLSSELYYCSMDGEDELADIHRRFNGRLLKAEIVCQHFATGDIWCMDCTNHMRVLYTCIFHLEGYLKYECDDDGGDATDPRNHRILGCGLGEVILKSTEELCSILVTITSARLYQHPNRRSLTQISFQ